MKLLELFKGTGSIGKVFKEVHTEGEIYSVDILKKYDPTFCGDIMDFDYNSLLAFIIFGITNGVVYGIVALGISLIYSGLDIVQ